MEEMGKLLAVVGVLLALIGVILWKFGGRIPLGHLPGDIYIQRPGFTFYFPLMTCILLSLAMTLLMRLFRH